ncbi:hypothetical protein [Vagococcus fluvialis]|uniref:hypothetical protein n=1 Tax=Vagococcus fluvialis TaxID=2738 RepID=UPI00379F3B06
MKDKKEEELYCLNKAIELGMKKQGITKRIITKLNGEFVKRDLEERPDFVRYLCSTTKQNETIVGIEHFRVDHLSLQKKNGSVASTGIMFDKESQYVYEKWREKINEHPDATVSAAKDIQNLVWEQFKRVKQTNYKTFIKSFEYSLAKHIDNVEGYRKELTKLSLGRKTELAFLIEVHSEFTGKFYNDENGVKKSNIGIMPMFSEVVDILERIDDKKVDYIILLLNESKINENSDVIAFKTGNISNQLKKQKKNQYQYIGMDYFEEAFIKVNNNLENNNEISINNNEITMNFEYNNQEIDEQKKIDILLNCCKLIENCKKENHNFIADLPVQMFYEILGDSIKVNRKLNRDIIEERSEKFFNKYL